MNHRLNCHLLALDKTQLVRGPKPALSNSQRVPDQSSSSQPVASDSACQPGQGSPKDQERNSWKRSSQNCPPPQPAHAVRSSGAVPKRKREYSSGERAEGLLPRSPNVQKADGEVSMGNPSVAKKRCAEPSQGRRSGLTS